MIHRAGTEIVNWYLLEEAGRVTIVDAGCPSYRSQLEGALAAIGRKIDDVDAIVLTHAHIDHVGFSQRLQDERGIPVYAHQEELPQAQTGKPPKTEGSFFPQLFRYPTARRVVFHIVRNAGARPPKVARVEPFSDGDELDVPGRPRAIHTPGHSASRARSCRRGSSTTRRPRLARRSSASRPLTRRPCTSATGPPGQAGPQQQWPRRARVPEPPRGDCGGG